MSKSCAWTRLVPCRPVGITEANVSHKKCILASEPDHRTVTPSSSALFFLVPVPIPKLKLKLTPCTQFPLALP